VKSYVMPAVAIVFMCVLVSSIVWGLLTIVWEIKARNPTPDQTPTRFTAEAIPRLNGGPASIITDHQTGKQYLWVCTSTPVEIKPTKPVKAER